MAATRWRTILFSRAVAGAGLRDNWGSAGVRAARLVSCSGAFPSSGDTRPSPLITPNRGSPNLEGRPSLLAVATCLAGSVYATGSVSCEELPDANAGESQRLECGKWRLNQKDSESMVPFLHGLGVPKIAAKVVDFVKPDLDISITQGALRVKDTTIFGENVTEVLLGAAEVERSTRTGRKRFLLSGFEDDGRLVVQCRLFQRGDGWLSQQSWKILPETGTLEEQLILKRPDEKDVVVKRIFHRLDAERKAFAEGPIVQKDGLCTKPTTFAISGLLLAVVPGIWYFCSWWSR